MNLVNLSSDEEEEYVLGRHDERHYRRDYVRRHQIDVDRTEDLRDYFKSVFVLYKKQEKINMEVKRFLRLHNKPAHDIDETLILLFFKIKRFRTISKYVKVYTYEEPGVNVLSISHKSMHLPTRYEPICEDEVMQMKKLNFYCEEQHEPDHCTCADMRNF